jgi:hypothetical protein
MIWLYSFLIVVLSSFLWRVRGGLRFKGKKAVLNKIWYAIFFSLLSCVDSCFAVENMLVGFIACYTSYQLYGWGEYIGGLLKGGAYNREVDTECELIDDLLYPCRLTIKGHTFWLKDYGHLFGFCGTCLTGLITTFIWGLFWSDILLMISGLVMGPCYWLGGKINNEDKNGWNLGEWIFGGVMGGILAWRLIW